MLTLTRDDWDPKRHYYPTELAHEEARLRIGEFVLKAIDNENGDRSDDDYRSLPVKFSGKAFTNQLGEKFPHGMAFEIVTAVADVQSLYILKAELLDPQTRARLVPWLEDQRRKVNGLRARQIVRGRA